MRVRSCWLLLVLAVPAALTGVGFAGAAGGAQTFTVDVDGHNPKANEAFIAYYPRVTSLHPGDTVVFHEVGNGEPHTVTLGTLVDGVAKQVAKLTPKQRQAPKPPPALLHADAKLPQLLPQGPGDAIQSAANPCVTTTGVPGKAKCPQRSLPDFTGAQSYYNSGWLNSNQKFTVHLSSSTPPGTYAFMCLLHREGMMGSLKVVPASTPVPSPSAQRATGAKELASVQAKLVPAVTALRKGKVPGLAAPGTNGVFAGSGSPSAMEAEITEFGPKTIKIPVGGSVTWYLLGPHSITFNSNKTNDDIRLTAPDGSVHLNPKAVAPVNGPGEPPPSSTGSSSSSGPPKFKVVASKTWNGQGFLNSGVFVNSFGPPLIEGYKLTFTKAGTYKYLCTVHDEMKGTVVVG